jgi:hypothetical protein
LDSSSLRLSVKEKSEQAKIDYDKKVVLAEQAQEEQENKQTSLGKERYQKDFFNKLDEGEHLIILYKTTEEEHTLNQEERKMYWWEEVEQSFLVWWRNTNLKQKI